LWFRFEGPVVDQASLFKRRKQIGMEKAVRKAEKQVKTVMVDIDPILKKISEQGMGSLTPDEKTLLDKASEVKRQQREKVIRFEDFRPKRPE